MKFRHLRYLLAMGLVNCLSVAALGANYATVQSNYKPLNWSLADKVQVANSDTASQAFNSNQATFLTYTSSLKEGVAYAGANNAKLDPQRLYFFASYAPRIYFISNGGWYTDALGVTIGSATAPNGKAPTGTNYTVFPNLNSPYNNTDSTKQVSKPSTFVPMQTGQFVQLPTVNVGQQMALVFMSNLDSNGNPANVFYNDPNANQDNYQHMVAFFPTNSQYFIVGFEDMYGGGDGDYNDVIVVVDVGPTNASLWRSGTLPK